MPHFYSLTHSLNERNSKKVIEKWSNGNWQRVLVLLVVKMDTWD